MSNRNNQNYNHRPSTQQNYDLYRRSLHQMEPHFVNSEYIPTQFSPVYSDNRGLFPGYVRNDNRQLPTGFQSSSFDNTIVQMQLQLANKQLSDRAKKEKRKKERVIQLLQENLPEGQKHVTICSDSDEDDKDGPTIVIDNESMKSAFSKQVVSTSELKRSHKRKHKKHSSTKQKKSRSKKRRLIEYVLLSSDDEERHRSRSSKKKHRKKSRRSSTSSSTHSSCSTFTSAFSMDNQSSREQRHLKNYDKSSSTAGILDQQNNPWCLLKSRDISYHSTHIVIDPRSDNNNQLFDKSSKRELAAHNSLKIALTADQTSFLLSEINLDTELQCRYFSPQIAKHFNRGRAGERRFRQKPSVFQDYLPISEFPYDSDDNVATLKNEINEEQQAKMNIDDLSEYKKSKKFVSYEDASLDGKKSILYTKCNLEPQDFKWWILYVELQPQIMANDECGDPTASVINKRALFERQIEILSRAIKSNPSNVELALKRLKLIENFNGIGSPEVTDAWMNLENRFINSLKMWELNIKLKQNNRTTFELSKIIKLIDKCLTNLVDLKDGIKLSHKPNEGTDNFLVDVIVQCCKLYIETGFFDKAIAVLQALTEFHFFAPVECKELLKSSRASRSRVLVESFANFWKVGVPRIGDNNALGWKNSDLKIDKSVDEFEFLQNQFDMIQQREKDLVNEIRKNNFSNIETWRQIEIFRSEQYWHPVRNVNHPLDVYEFTSRIVQFKEIQRMIFTFGDKKHAFDLIFRILQLLGAVIVGLKEYNQQDILRQFASDSLELFPYMSLNFYDLDKFFLNYFDLLLKVEGIDKIRIHCSKLATRIKFLNCLNCTAKGKKLRMNQYMNEFYNLKASNLDNAVFFYHYAQLCETLDLSLLGFKVGLTIINGMNKSVWEMKGKERATYLQILCWVCKRLPFTLDEFKKEKEKEKETASKNEPKTKFELLYWIGISGMPKQVEKNLENDNIAYKNWKSCLTYKKEDTSCEGEFAWFCNEYESIVELSSLYFYTTFYSFASFKKLLQCAPLAKLVANNESIYQLQLSVYEHRIQTSVNVTPYDLKNLLKKAIEKFPHNVLFLKKFIKLSGAFKSRFFLQMNPGTDELTKRVRTCALIYIEWCNYIETMENGSVFQKKKCFDALSSVLEKAAAEISDSSMPDSYVWCLLMRIEQESCSPVRRIDEVFTLAQKQCPWSKRLLLETAWRRTDVDGFQSTLTSVISTVQLQQYCALEEVPLLFEPDIHDEKILEDENLNYGIVSANNKISSTNNSVFTTDSTSLAVRSIEVSNLQPSSSCQKKNQS